MWAEYAKAHVFFNAFDGSATEKEQEEIVKEVQEVGDLAAKAYNLATEKEKVQEGKGESQH